VNYQAPLVTIGDITCTQDHVVTPSGTMPIGQVSWTFTNLAQTRQETPTWAVVCAIVGFFLVCFLSLLFLLAKEDKTTGWAQVTVQGPGFVHTAQVPIYSALNVTDYSARVDYARSLSAAASAGRVQS
jgi:hypothetical protein